MELQQVDSMPHGKTLLSASYPDPSVCSGPCSSCGKGVLITGLLSLAPLGALLCVISASDVGVIEHSCCHDSSGS